MKTYAIKYLELAEKHAEKMAKMGQGCSEQRQNTNV
jgi:hypothetical protein